MARPLLLLLALLAACTAEAGAPDAPPLPPAPDAGPAVYCVGAAVPPATGDVLEQLRAVPGMSQVTEEPSQLQGYRFFTMVFAQPVDHTFPGGATFGQRLTVLARNASAPTVLATQGYDLDQRPLRTEPTALVSANQVAVEHRFFTPSRPDPVDWSKLTIWQAAADHHCVVTLLRPLFTGPWLSTGASKGGMTATYHRRYFPDDVVGTVAYVAPFCFGAPDPRYVAKVETGPNPACRQRLRDFQRIALSKRDDMLAKMAQSGVTFNILGPEKALEHAVLELPFSFWQYFGAGECGNIPGSLASSSAVYAFIDRITIGIDTYGDEQFVKYEPYYYQAATELGYPEINEATVADLLQYPGTDTAETYSPPGVPTHYDLAVMQDIDAWVRARGERLLFIYGDSDPWSAGAYELGDARDSFRLFVSGGNHDVGIGDLSDDDRGTALGAISRWLGVSARLQALTPEERALVQGIRHR
jgi:hypothetical protein